LCLEKEQNYYANSVYFISLQFLRVSFRGKIFQKILLRKLPDFLRPAQRTDAERLKKNGVATFYFFIFADTAPLRGIYKK
jgi:hypothetical protein